MATTRFLVFVAVLGSCALACCSLKPPSYISLCSRNDPDLNKCVLEKGRITLDKIIKLKGDRKYNIPSVTPMLITKLHIDASGLNLTLNNLELFGLEDAIIMKAKVDLKNRREEFEILLPRLEIVGDYEVSGRILLLPITGHGPANITLPNLSVLISHDFDLKKGKTGKEHIVTKNKKLVLLGEPTAHLQLDNLFGNKALSDNMNLILNENSKEVVQDVGPAIAHAFGLAVHQIFDGLMSLVSFDDLYPMKV